MHIWRPKYVHLRIKMFGWLSINYLTFSRPLWFGGWMEIWWITSTTQMLEEKLCFDCFSGSLKKKKKNTLKEWQGYTKKYNPHGDEFPKPLRLLFLWFQIVYHYWHLILHYWSCHKVIFFYFLIKAITTKYEEKKKSPSYKQVPNISHFLMALLMLV